MPLRKILKIYATVPVMTILVLFEQFVDEFCLNFLPLMLSASPHMMHFVCTFLIYSCLRRKAYCY